jgi:SAM-dependent methyltransferase
VNRYLGGYAASFSELSPWLLRRADKKTRLLDIGTGIADFPEVIVGWASRQKPPIDVEVVGVDANPATIAYAKKALASRLPAELMSRITLLCADAHCLPFPDNSFDIAISSMFLHHFEGQEAARIVRSMHSVARCGVIINDLRRHPLAYYGIAALTRILPASPMVRHDAPLSVLRGFRRNELADIAKLAGLPAYRLCRRWAFRWVLSSLAVEQV